MALAHVCYLAPWATQFSLPCGCRMMRRPDAYVDLFACEAHAPSLVPLAPPPDDLSGAEHPPDPGPPEEPTRAPARRPAFRYHPGRPR
jgi:hypothetical protein